MADNAAKKLEGTPFMQAARNFIIGAAQEIGIPCGETATKPPINTSANLTEANKTEAPGVMETVVGCAKELGFPFGETAPTPTANSGSTLSGKYNTEAPGFGETVTGLLKELGLPLPMDPPSNKSGLTL